jgi:hypothetical protein
MAQQLGTVLAWLWIGAMFAAYLQQFRDVLALFAGRM